MDKNKIWLINKVNSQPTTEITSQITIKFKVVFIFYFLHYLFWFIFYLNMSFALKEKKNVYIYIGYIIQI